MEPVYTGRPICGRHDEGKHLLADGDLPRRRAGYRDILFPPRDSTMPLLAVRLGFLVVVDTLVLTAPSMLGRGARQSLLQRWPEPYPERVFLVGKLVDEIACVAPDGEVGLDGAGVGGPPAGLLLVRRLLGLVWSWGGGEGVEGYIGRPPRARVEGRNLEGSGLEWSSPDSEQVGKECGCAGWTRLVEQSV